MPTRGPDSPLRPILLLLVGAWVLAIAPGRTVLAGEPPADPPAAGRDALRETYIQRFLDLPAGDDEAAMELAAWAIEEGLLDEADDVYRMILDDDPDHEGAYHELWHLSRARPRPKESKPYEVARAALGESFVEYETTRYVVLSDADPKWVRVQAERLERTYDRFIRFANGLGLRAQPLRHKLVAVVFGQQRDFAAFGRKDGNTRTGRIAGYYSPVEDRLVFYHVESEQNVAAARADLETMYAEADATRQASRRARNTGRREEGREMQRELDAQLEHLSEQERRLNDFARERSIAVTVHEAIHQLMFHTSVQARHVHHPAWLTEGLATAFETDAPRSPFGPGEEFAPRREGFWNLLDNDRLMPLRALVRVDQGGLSRNPGHVAAVYLQGYALVTWMSRYRRAELRDYLRKLNAAGSGAIPPDRHEALFEEVFGDIDRLEEAWLRHEKADG